MTIMVNIFYILEIANFSKFKLCVSPYLKPPAAGFAICESSNPMLGINILAMQMHKELSITTAITNLKSIYFAKMKVEIVANPNKTTPSKE